MISFTMLTDTPGRLRDFLLSRGIIKEEIVEGQATYTGARPGVEIVEIPNPIVTDPGSGEPGEPGFVPETRDTRRAFMVKLAYESESEKADGFRNWVINNSTVATAPANYTIGGEPVGDARKVNGEQVWLVHDRPERFGTWL